MRTSGRYGITVSLKEKSRATENIEIKDWDNIKNTHIKTVKREFFTEQREEEEMKESVQLRRSVRKRKPLKK